MFRENLHAKDFIFIAVILFIYALVATSLLEHSSLWLDEVSQVFGFKLPLGDLVKWLTGDLKSQYIIRDASPPTFYLIQKLFLNKNADLQALRYLSVIISGLTIPVFYLTLRINFKTVISAITLLWFSTSPVFLQNALSIRSYPLFIFICSISLFYLILFFHQGKNYFLKLSLVIACLSSAVHFYGLIFFSFIILFLYLSTDGKEIKKNFIFISISLLLTVTLLTPLLLSSTGRSLGFVPSSLIDIIFNFLYFTFFHEASSTSMISVIINIISFIIIILFNLKLFFNRLSPHKVLVTAFLVLLTILMASFLKNFNILKPRYYIWLLLFFFLAVASIGSKVNIKAFLILSLINIFINFYSTVNSSHFFRNSSLPIVEKIKKDYQLDQAGYIINTGEFISLPLRYTIDDLTYNNVKYSYRLGESEKNEFLNQHGTILCITQRRRLFKDLISFNLDLVDTCTDMPKQWKAVYKGFDINRKSISQFTLYSKNQ